MPTHVYENWTLIYTFEFRRPTATYSIFQRLPGAGEYRVIIYSDDKEIYQETFSVIDFEHKMITIDKL